ncbi:MAG TPA: hypothetical protein VN408_43335 [Actinoplanes sp.]|nr:hypothetical protein [Actinoplanes sp.]
METARGRTIAWLGHPVTMAALALLVVNDHVLKAAHPGWVTGKLSDVAGMVLAPPLLAALAGLIGPRLPFRWVAAGSIVAVGVGFGFVKACGYGAQLASAVWSLAVPSLIRADPADLLALPFLAVAWWTAQRSARARDRRVVRAVRLAVLLPIALMGVAATSPNPRPLAQLVNVADGRIHLGGSDGQGGGLWMVSDDLGATWTPEPEPADRPGRHDCTTVVPQICYRVIPDAIGVESNTGGGPWTVSWQIGEADRQSLSRVYPDVAYSGDLTSRQLAVLDTGTAHVVVVANGRDGFALRTADGQWNRIGIPGLPGDMAPADPGRAVTSEVGRTLMITFAVFAAGFALTAFGLARAGRPVRRRPLVVLGVAAVLCLALQLLVYLRYPAVLDSVFLYGALVIAAIVAVGCAGSALLAAAWRQ